MVCYHIFGFLVFLSTEGARATAAKNQLTSAMNNSSVHIDGEEYINQWTMDDGAIVLEFSIAFPTTTERETLKDKVKLVVPYLDQDKFSSLEVHRCYNDEDPPTGECDTIVRETWGTVPGTTDHYHRSVK